MTNLKELKGRISSVKSTQKITKAMQMVAAAKLRKAQTAAENARPYAVQMEDVIRNLAIKSMGHSSAPRILSGTGRDDVHLLVVATAERGLCGGFNTSIVKKARETMRQLSATGKTFKIICVGKKGYDVLKRTHKDVIIDVVDLRNAKTLSFHHADDIAQRILALFEEGAFDVATLFFSEFQSVISQIPQALQLIPYAVDDEGDGYSIDSGASALYEYEPGEEEILETLLPRNIAVQIFRGLLENSASEQGARMSAMDNATRNAGEMIKGLTLTYNRTRQAMITKELIEIISGAEAL